MRSSSAGQKPGEPTACDPDDREPQRDDEPIASDRTLSDDDEGWAGYDDHHGYRDDSRGGYDEDRDHHVADRPGRSPNDNANDNDNDNDELDFDLEEADLMEVLDHDDLTRMDGPDA